ncbi:serine hydrolase [Tenacibaculum xiamenense]|uniref:serine hydrolase n=1 Tax=Tenacibaculum xiamenense TaxID=1261553 RepID=UPI003895B7CC
MTLKSIIICILIVAMPVVCHCQNFEENRTLKAKINDYLKEGVTNGFHGAILVAKKGKIIINEGYGLANKEKNRKNTSSTVFDIGSNTKQFTAAAILKLEGFKKLKLSDPLCKYFKDLPNDKKQITIHQLLTHSSGLVELVGHDFDKITREAFFTKVFNSELLHAPGTKYSYSNIGYSILARIIELVSNMNYESFLNQHLFKPSGMTQTGYLLPYWSPVTLAVGYAKNIIPRGPMVNMYKKEGKVSWHLKGNGGINSTQEDMYKWYLALKNNTVLTAAQFEKLITPYGGPESNRYKVGYGWGIINTNRKTKRISHNGGNGGFCHTILWNIDEDVLVLYSSNASSLFIEGVAYTVEKMVFNSSFKPEPIKKNPYFMVVEFVKNNSVSESKNLVSLIKNKHKTSFEKPEILNRLGYIVLKKFKNKEWALELFKANANLFPEEANVWDSLGEAYLELGNKLKATQNYKKAANLGSENSKEVLKELLKN